MSDIGQGRILRVCDLCGGVDDHPRHVIAGAPGGGDVVTAPTQEAVDAVLASAPAGEAARLLRDLFDTTTSDRHMDCCRQAGCPDGSCDQVTAGAESKTGKALLTHLTKKGEGS